MSSYFMYLSFRIRLKLVSHKIYFEVLEEEFVITIRQRSVPMGVVDIKQRADVSIQTIPHHFVSTQQYKLQTK